MAIWVEFRCEGRTEFEGCQSNKNDGPMSLSDDNGRAVLATISFLSAEARRFGWRHTREGWFCPLCLKAKKEKAE